MPGEPGLWAHRQLRLRIAAAARSVAQLPGLMSDDRSIPPICSPYVGELPARDKIADVHTPGYLQATERHLRFATARLGLFPVQQFSTRAAGGQQRN
jgi:hypothetical protein